MHLRTWQHHMTTIMQPFQCDLQLQIQETNRTTHSRNNHSLQNTEEEPVDLETIQAAPAAHRRYLSSPAAATLHGRIQGFVLRAFALRPKTKPMQHSCSHYKAFCSMTWLTRMHLRTWQHQMTTNHAAIPMQICNNRFKKRIELRTQEQPLVAEHRGGTDWPRNDPNRTRRTQEVLSSPGCSHFTQKNARFRAPASSPKPKPHATFMQPLQFVLQHGVAKPASFYAHGNTRWQPSCSHSNTICNHRVKKRIELRTQEQPLVAEHRGGTDWPRNDPSRTLRTQEVPFIAGCSHFTRKNTRFRAPASSPKQSPCNIHAAIAMRFAAWRG